ncbi:MAG: ABC transporter permease [Anaerolineae bacterium]|nr:ABC transporter permease [Anaerolineae bacterium]MBT4311059.1 ABC transporter permease [Anaerolineae bacterium]MBT7191411.1 ABC transporter permease [Anaerolineae bacterium]MBT7989071.1 ABC transporter permease [Anaerolineae bacterium]
MIQIDYILRKIIFSLMTLAAVIVFNFFLFRIIPGDPIAMISSPRMKPETRDLIREQYGLDKPIWLNLDAAREEDRFAAAFDSQFFYYLKNLSQGELGQSFRQKQPVADLIAMRLGPTILLILTGEIAAILLGITLGIIAAWKAKSKIDALSMFVGLLAWSIPPFWMGIVLLTTARGYLPSGGYETIGAIFESDLDRWLDIGRHLVLPALTMAITLFGSYIMVARSASLEVLAEDYILTAKAKGLSTFKILWAHALKNAALPLATVIALDLGYALGGAIQIETIFSWPGIGRLMFDSIAQRDYPVLQGVFLLLAVSVILANFLADLTYLLLDPRVEA